MKKQQFKRMQQAVQDAVDDHRRQSMGVKATHHQWHQGSWGSGTELGHEMQARNKNGNLRSVITVPITCGTTACIAGNGVINNGDKFVVPKSALDQVELGESFEVEKCVDLDGNLFNISSRARELFGLEANEAEWLFGGGNDIEAVESIAEDLATKYGHTLNIDHERPLWSHNKDKVNA